MPDAARNWGDALQPDPTDGDYLRIRREDLEAFKLAKGDQASDADTEKQRSTFAVSSFPSTPRFLQREAGGFAVRRGAHRNALSMDALRIMRDRSLIFAPIHRARQHQIRRLCEPWNGDRTKVGVKVVHKDWNQQDSDPPAGFERYVKQFEEVLWRPSEQYGYLTLGDALAELEEDLLTLNRPAIEVMHSIIDPRRILEWRPVDGGLVWPTLHYVEHWWSQNPMVHGWARGQLLPKDRVELLSEKLRVDLAAMDYCLVREGIAEAWYPKDRLIVGPWRNRTDVTFAGYPPSALEEAIPWAAAFADAVEFTSGYLSKGIFLDYILGLPATMHPQDADAFLDMLMEMHSGVKNRGRVATIALPPGAENALQRIPLQPEFNEMGFASMISLCQSTIASGIYRMHPSTIGGRPWDAGGGSRLGEGNQTMEIGLAQEEGLRSDMGHLVSRFLNELARRCHPDLRVYVHYGDFDAQKEAVIIQTRTQSTMTVNEGRLAENLPPLGFWIPDAELNRADDEERAQYSDNPYNHPMPICMQLLQAKVQQNAQQQMMQQQMQQQQAQAAMGGDFTQFEDPEPPPQGQPMNKAAPRTVTLHIHGGSY